MGCVLYSYSQVNHRLTLLGAQGMEFRAETPLPPSLMQFSFFKGFCFSPNRGNVCDVHVPYLRVLYEYDQARAARARGRARTCACIRVCACWFMCTSSVYHSYSYEYHVLVGRV